MAQVFYGYLCIWFHPDMNHVNDLNDLNHLVAIGPSEFGTWSHWALEDCSWRVLFSPVKVPGLRPQSSPCLLTYDNSEEYVEECDLAGLVRSEFTPVIFSVLCHSNFSWITTTSEFPCPRQTSWRLFQSEAGLHPWQGSLCCKQDNESSSKANYIYIIIYNILYYNNIFVWIECTAILAAHCRISWQSL